MDLRHAAPVASEASAPTVDTGQDLTPSAERRRDRETLTLMAICLLLMGAVVGWWSTAVPPRTVDPFVTNGASRVTQTAPPFALPDLTGTMVRLSNYQGKVVVLNIWATWCPPCVRETPRLVRLAQQYQDAGLVVLGVNAT
ncbi:MAG TPA: TlpA disulfide reductase family protein, partial [Herpetosiphonaceae bacterium]